MIKLLSIFFFFFTLLCYSQIQDWKGILAGDFQTLKKENVKFLVLRKNGEISKKMEIGQNTILLYNNDKLSQEFYFDTNGKLLKYDLVPQISVDFLENSKIKNYSYVGEEVLKYEFDNSSKELLFEKKIPVKGIQTLTEARYFVKNKIDSTLSYQDFFSGNKRSRYYEDHETNVTFRPLRDYTGAEINDRQIAKDSVISGKKEEKYYFNRKNELINKTIIRDSIYETGYENNRIDYYILEFKGNRYFHEQYRNGILDVSIKNKYCPTENGTLVLWKVLRYDVASKKKYTEYPNKSIYKLKNNILVKRNSIKDLKILISCGGFDSNDHRVSELYMIETFSHSILFDEKLQRTFHDNFEANSVDSLSEIFNATLMFSANPTLINRSGENDTDYELIRTSKKIYMHKEKWNTYFSNFQLEVVTNSNKKYHLNLTGQFENFSFPIYAIFLKN